MTEKALHAWKPLPVNARVQVNRRCKYRRGEYGIVKERLDNEFTGLGRYGIILDSDPRNTADFRRFELTRVTP